MEYTHKRHILSQCHLPLTQLQPFTISLRTPGHSRIRGKSKSKSHTCLTGRISRIGTIRLVPIGRVGAAVGVGGAESVRGASETARLPTRRLVAPKLARHAHLRTSRASVAIDPARLARHRHGGVCSVARSAPAATGTRGCITEAPRQARLARN